MLKNTQISQDRNTARRIVMVVYPDAHILDVVGPLEVLTGTRYFLPGNEQPYDVCVVAEQAGPVRTTSGLTIQADASFAELQAEQGAVDTLMVCGGHGTVQALENEPLLRFVADTAPRAERIVSICTGAMILAQVGLLNGKRATTHWWWCPEMSKRFPEVEVQADAIYIRDGNIWTSAGVTTGMDLALSLVEMDWGHDVALQVARYNVMYMMRPGGQSQFSAHLVAQQANDPLINATLDYVLNNPADPLTVTALAARAHMPERTFARKFKDETGMTPAQYVEAARIQNARVALEQSDTGIEQIALQAGFQSAERMRRAFHRHVGVTATEYRERFRPLNLHPPAS